MAKDPNTPPKLPKSPKRPADQTSPPYTPGGVPEPEGELPSSPAEHTPPPNTYPPKQKP
ncbi:MAG TPA: hypothetical protein VD978_17630 [Azospirillum sp.]|nr:hypothetical protein [Azospirillum sp.]